MKQTKVQHLAGRVIENVTIFHGEGNENPLALEIRCVGGAYFSFEIAADVNIYGVSTLSNNHSAELGNKRTRRFDARGTVPYAAPMED